MAGTWVLKGFNQGPNFTGSWTDGGLTEDMSGAGNYGEVYLPIPFAGLYLDGAITPTAYDDLPDDFGIDTITLNPAFFSTDNGSVDVESPVIDASDIGIWAGGLANFFWNLNPLNLYKTEINGISDSNTTLANPYLGLGLPPVFTKWNNYLRLFLNNSYLIIGFGATSIGPFYFNVSALKDAGAYTWEIRGTYDSFPAPPDPTIYPTGGLAFGGAAVVQALTDASGIYTIVPNQYHDELYQRTSSTTSTTVNVMIPAPFFKTGFIGGR